MQLKLSSDELLKLGQVDAISYILLRQKSLGLPISPTSPTTTVKWGWSDQIEIFGVFKGKDATFVPCHTSPVTLFGRSLNRRLDDLILSYVIWGTEGSSLYRQLLLPAASVVIALMSITALTPQAVVVIVLEVVDVEVELVVTLAITALTPQAALSAVTHHWSRVVGRNQPTCPTYTGGGSRKQTRTGSILSQDEEKWWSYVLWAFLIYVAIYLVLKFRCFCMQCIWLYHIGSARGFALQTINSLMYSSRFNFWHRMQAFRSPRHESLGQQQRGWFGEIQRDLENARPLHEVVFRSLPFFNCNRILYLTFPVDCLCLSLSL